MRKDDTELLRQVNAALKAIMDDGELRRILERWKLWTPTMAAELNDFSPSTVAPVMYDQFMRDTAPAKNWRATVLRYMQLPSAAGRGCRGHAGSLHARRWWSRWSWASPSRSCRRYGPPFVATLTVGYIETVRGTPLLIQILFIFYGLPNIGIKLDPFVAGVLALGLNYAAYEAENYRAGLRLSRAVRWRPRSRST